MTVRACYARNPPLAVGNKGIKMRTCKCGGLVNEYEVKAGTKWVCRACGRIEVVGSENPKGLLNSGELNQQGITGYARNHQEGHQTAR